MDITSDSKGGLIPRMETNAYRAILNPANGLMLYDQSNDSFVYFDDTNWVSYNSIDSEISDSNKDTYISVEGTPNEDTISAYIEGEWQLKMSINEKGDLSIHENMQVFNLNETDLCSGIV